MMQRCVAREIALVDVVVQLFDEILERRHPGVRRMPMGVACKAIAVADSGRRMNGIGAGTGWHRLHRGVRRRIDGSEASVARTIGATSTTAAREGGRTSGTGNLATCARHCRAAPCAPAATTGRRAE